MSIFNHFQHINLTNDQQSALEKIQDFLNSDENVFILKGYAGTGKTTILKGICNYLKTKNKSSHLMAPTGRAAMILSEKTGRDATTIHRGIYNFNTLIENQNNDIVKYRFGLKNNEDYINTIYIIDEASMISDSHSEDDLLTFGSGYLLKDLLDYTFMENCKSKVIFVGDNAQLPPVGMNYSPALSAEHLKDKYQIDSTESIMRTVVRQRDDASLLKTSMRIRESIEKKSFNNFEIDEGSDIAKIKHEEFLKIYAQTAKQNIEDVTVITHSNKRATTYNKDIRALRYSTEESPIRSRDRLIITRNNYNHTIDLFNGIFVEVSKVDPEVETKRIALKIEGGKIINREIIFRNIEISVNGKLIQTCIIDNFLSSEAPNMHPYDQRALFVDFKIRMQAAGIKPKSDAFKEMLVKDKYLNAIQAKYGYAVTCHKSQGGEWKNVFVDFNVFIEKHTLEYYRWSYTAITRAKENLICVDLDEFNALSSYEILDVKTIKKVSANRYYTPDGSDFIEFRKTKIEELAIQQEIRVSFSDFENQLFPVFENNTNKAHCRLWYNNKGFKKTTGWALSDDTTFNTQVKSILIQSLITDDIPFEYKFDFQFQMYQNIKEILRDENTSLTNIEQREWSDVYYLQTEAESASIEFNFDKNHKLTKAQPFSTLGNKDEKLNIIINKLRG